MHCSLDQKKSAVSVRSQSLKRGEGTSLICGDFSVALRGGLRFGFNFELGQWIFACHHPYTKSSCKNIFQVIISTPSTSTTHLQSQPPGAGQVGYPWPKLNIWNMFHERFLKRKQSGWVPRWSEGSRTPSATLTSSTMGSTASTIYIHKNEHLKHVSWTIFKKKTIWMGPKVIWGL